MFGIGPWELIVVFAIVLLLFGGKRLPSLATGLGGAIRNFKKAMNDGESEDVAEKKVLTKDAQGSAAKATETTHS